VTIPSKPLSTQESRTSSHVFLYYLMSLNNTVATLACVFFMTKLSLEANGSDESVRYVTLLSESAKKTTCTERDLLHSVFVLYQSSV
jgi:hypothetical protein